MQLTRSVVLSPLLHSQHRGPRPQVSLRLSELFTYLVRQVVWSRVRGVFLPVLGQFARLKALKNILRVSKGQDLNSRVLHKYVHFTKVSSAVPRPNAPESFARYKEFGEG